MNKLQIFLNMLSIATLASPFDIFGMNTHGLKTPFDKNFKPQETSITASHIKKMIL